ncbi:MAG: hypothetical protein OHK0022_05760 [Roseiflexaceae bacterium]
MPPPTPQISAWSIGESLPRMRGEGLGAGVVSPAAQTPFAKTVCQKGGTLPPIAVYGWGRGGMYCGWGLEAMLDAQGVKE